MSFREKIEWATLVALVGGFGWYFATLYKAIRAAGSTLEHGPGLFVNMGLLAVTVVIMTIIMTVSAIIFAIKSPDEANAPADEREKNISLQSTRFAYFILLVGTLCIFAAAHFGHGLYFILNLLLAVIVLSEILRVAISLWLYRKG